MFIFVKKSLECERGEEEENVVLNAKNLEYIIEYLKENVRRLEAQY